MNKRIVYLFAALALIALLITSLVMNQDELHNNLFTNRFDFTSPYLVSADTKDNIYLVDNRSKRLTKMKPNGEVQFTLEGGKRGVKDFYLILDMQVADNYIYIVNVEVDLSDGYAGIYEVKRYTTDGVYDKTIVHYVRSKEERLGREGEILGNIQVKDGFLYYVFYKDKVSTMYKKAIDDKALPATTAKTASGTNAVNTIDLGSSIVKIPERFTGISITGTEPGKIYFTKLDGKIYQVDSEGNLMPFTYKSTKDTYLASPWGIAIDNNGDIFSTDIEKQSIFKITPGGESTVFMNKDILRANNYNVNSLIFRYFSLDKKENTIVIVDEFNSRILYLKGDGKLEFSLTKGFYSLKLMLIRWLIWLQFLPLIVLIPFLIYLFYKEVMKGRLPVMVKMLLIFIPLIVASIVIVSFRIYSDLYKRQADTIVKNVAMIAQIGADKIDGNALERITRPEHFRDADYRKVQTEMHAIMNDNADEWNALPYSRIYKRYGDIFYITIDWSERYGVLYPYTFATQVHKDAFEKGKIGYTNYSDFDSDLIVGVAPIKNTKGDITGVYEVIMDKGVLDELNALFVTQLVWGVIVSLIVFILISTGFIYLILRSLQMLSNAIKDVSGGKWDTSIDIRSKDEVGDLGAGFNIMAGFIRRYISEITSLNKAYVKFVPSEFLKFLGRTSIIDVRLGDQVQKEMSVLFSDIRSFTSLSETMSPEENFNFINSYLKRVGPIIRNNTGFIDKYIGDAIMALFPNEAETSVQAAIEMRKKLEQYNTERIIKGYVAIDIGVGIHTGPLMLGIVGEEERLNCTVISDNVNLASRLEGLTKMYGAGIIVSETTLYQIPGYATRYKIRFLDKVIVKGKSQPVSIFEIMDGDSLHIQDLKQKTMSYFEDAISSYQSKKLEHAMALFKKILEINDHDKAAAIYVKRCEHYMKFGIPENWEGVEALTEK